MTTQKVWVAVNGDPWEADHSGIMNTVVNK